MCKASSIRDNSLVVGTCNLVGNRTAGLVALLLSAQVLVTGCGAKEQDNNRSAAVSSAATPAGGEAAATPVSQAEQLLRSMQIAGIANGPALGLAQTTDILTISNGQLVFSDGTSVAVPVPAGAPVELSPDASDDIMAIFNSSASSIPVPSSMTITFDYQDPSNPSVSGQGNQSNVTFRVAANALLLDIELYASTTTASDTTQGINGTTTTTATSQVIINGTATVVNVPCNYAVTMTTPGDGSYVFTLDPDSTNAQYCSTVNPSITAIVSSPNFPDVNLSFASPTSSVTPLASTTFSAQLSNGTAVLASSSVPFTITVNDVVSLGAAPGTVTTSVAPPL